MNKSMWFITLKSHRINCSCLVTKKNKNADSSYSIIVTGHKKSLSDTGADWVFTNGSCCNSEDNERPGRQNSMVSHWFKVKLSPKCNLGCFFFFFCECPRVKPSCKSIITMKEALLRLTIFSFSAQTRFQWECYGHFYASIKIAILKTLRRTIWNFAHSIARVKRNENTVDLESAYFIVIMLSHEGLTHIHSQKKSLCCTLNLVFKCVACWLSLSPSAWTKDECAVQRRSDMGRTNMYSY